VDGKPVIFAYDRVLRQMPMINWPDVVQGTRDKMGDFILIADSFHSQVHDAYLFDGVNSLDFEFIPGHLRTDPGVNFGEFKDWAERQYSEHAKVDRQRSRICCLEVIRGLTTQNRVPPA
jgi:hypothetical protein